MSSMGRINHRVFKLHQALIFVMECFTIVLVITAILQQPRTPTLLDVLDQAIILVLHPPVQPMVQAPMQCLPMPVLCRRSLPLRPRKQQQQQPKDQIWASGEILTNEMPLLSSATSADTYMA